MARRVAVLARGAVLAVVLARVRGRRVAGRALLRRRPGSSVVRGGGIQDAARRAGLVGCGEFGALASAAGHVVQHPLRHRVRRQVRVAAPSQPRVQLAHLLGLQ